MAFLLPSHFSSFCQPDGPSSTKNGTTLLGCEICRLKFTACHVRLRTSSQLDGWASSFSPSRPFHQLRFALPFRLFLNSPNFVPMYKIATGHEIQSIDSHGTGNQDDGQLAARGVSISVRIRFRGTPIIRRRISNSDHSASKPTPYIPIQFKSNYRN
jgi:hypothetical protein